MSAITDGLPQIRFEIPEAAHILRMSGAALYSRIQEGALKLQKDGRRSYITAAEIERYVTSKGYPVAAYERRDAGPRESPSFGSTRAAGAGKRSPCRSSKTADSSLIPWD